MSIKFNKYNVTNTDTKIKARIFYSIGRRYDERACVTLYAKDYDRSLGKIFKDEYVNDTDSQSDYFDEGRVTLFTDHPLYEQALKMAALQYAGSKKGGKPCQK